MAGRFAFDWVDAFTTRPFGGNGCVVVHDAQALPLAERLALVRETSLSECAFMVGSDKADFGARYYLADREIPMAGHPTIAVAASLVDRGLVPLTDGRAEFTLEVGAGVLPISVRQGDAGIVITMTQSRPVFEDFLEPSDIAEVYGIDAADIIGRPQVVSTGTPFVITVLNSHEALRRARLDPARWRALNPSGAGDNALLEPFLVTLKGVAGGDTFARLLLAPPLPAEDPFTGSATGCMGAYLWHHGLIDRPEFIAEQGHWMGRPGRAEVRVLGPRAAPTGVRVGGSGRVLMRGDVLL